MGVEPYVLAAVLRGVLAQRLVRRKCTHCRDAEVEGCTHCNGTGYAGRVAIGELAQLDADLVESLAKSLDLDADRRLLLQASGYRSLKEDADRRLARGEIDEAEVRGLLDVG
jgi:type II secretory ATPase GspE/PulE/Tfp pilus assembly ATPase PilB-like protein